MTTEVANDVIRIFVGCDPNNCDLEQMMVLDYSIRKHTTKPVEITWMQLSHDTNSAWYSDPKAKKGWDTKKWATPFSGFRWAIPEYCDFEGRAIYMDADVVVLCDIDELWQHSITNDAVVAAKGEDEIIRLCTCVWDCAKAKTVLPSISAMQRDAEAHGNLMTKFKTNVELIETYQDSFNCVDGEDLPIEKIKVLHYSDMGTQFTHKYAIPRVESEGRTHWFDGKIMPHPRQALTDLFDTYYQEALDNGYTLEDYRITPFGDFPKKTHKKYKGNKVTRADSKKGLFGRLFNR